MSDKGTLTSVFVKDLPESILSAIPEGYEDIEVYYLNIKARKKTTVILYDYLNKKFVRQQLGLTIPYSDLRDSWYLVDDQLKNEGGIDLSGSATQQYQTLTKSIYLFCKYLVDFYKVDYWGFVYEKLNLKSKAKATVFDLQLKGILLDDTTLDGNPSENLLPEKFNECAFFFLVCEKEAVLLNVMRGLKSAGYDNYPEKHAWFGINTGGYATTDVIKLIKKFSGNHKFYILVLHDYDLDGLSIFFDMKKYFPCESVGLNPDLMDGVSINIEAILQPYKTTSGSANNAQLKGTNTILNAIKKDIDDQEYNKYTKWIDGCITGRAELQSLTGVRLGENMNLNPARDFVNYIEDRLENIKRTYDLNRLTQPETYELYSPPFELSRPQIIDDIIDGLKEEIELIIEDYLRSLNLNEDNDWFKLVEYQYLRMNKGYKKINKIFDIFLRVFNRRFIRINKRYEESLKKVRKRIRNQRNQNYAKYNSFEDFLSKLSNKQLRILNRIYSKLPEYKEMIKPLKELEKDVKDAIKKIKTELENDNGDENHY